MTIRRYAMGSFEKFMIIFLTGALAGLFFGKLYYITPVPRAPVCEECKPQRFSFCVKRGPGSVSLWTHDAKADSENFTACTIVSSNSPDGRMVLGSTYGDQITIAPLPDPVRVEEVILDAGGAR